MTARRLDALFAPRSIALVGASDDPMKWGGWLARSLTAQPGAPPVHLVNRRGGTVHGRHAYTSVAELDEAPDLVVLAVPGAAVPDAAAEALAAGARALVVIAAGFGEASDDGRRAQEALVAAAEAAGAVVLGPNCLGLFDPGGGVNASGAEMTPGAVAFCGQSGNLALELARLLGDAGLGFSRFASVGNQAQVTAADVLASVADHAATRVAATYVEDPVDGPAFVDAVRGVAERKPVLVLQGGRSRVGARAARSHTGALAGSSRVLAAAVRDAGGIPVATLGELDATRALLAGARPRGRRIAVVADGGGHGVVAADLLADAGLEAAELELATAARLAPELPNSEPVNPVDLAGAGEQDVRSFARISRLLLEAPEVDGVLVTGYFGGYAEYAPAAGPIEEEVARDLVAASHAADKPLLLHSMLVPGDPPGIAALRRAGGAAYERVEQAVGALAAIVERRPAPRRQAAQAAALALGPSPAYPEARALLAACGLPFEPGELARDPDEAAAVAARLGGRLALKAVGAGLLHKTEAGGVLLDVPAADAGEAAARLLARVRAAAPGLVLEGVFVERMAAAGGVDLVVGAHRDPRFGPVVLVGAGGIYAEALDDVAIALAPAAPAHVQSLLHGLAAWPLLAGARGQPPVDLAAVAQAVVALGDLLCGRPDLAEVEVNPLRATAAGVLALDARVVPAGLP